MDDDKKIISDDNLQRMKARLPEYLQSLGVDLKKGNFSCLCGTHEDRNPSMSYNRKNNTVKCFSCGFTGDVVDLIRVREGLTDYRSAVTKAAEILGMPDAVRDSSLTGRRKPSTQGPSVAPSRVIKQQPKQPSQPTPAASAARQPEVAEDPTEVISAANRVKDVAAMCERAHQAVGQTNYWSQRGLTPETVSRFRLGYCRDFNGHRNNEAAIIPTGTGTYSARILHHSEHRPKYFKTPGAEVPLFNEEALKHHAPVFVVEGEIDAMTMEQAGLHAVGLGSLNNGDKLVRHPALASFGGVLVIAFDNDPEADKKEKARTAANQLKTALLKAGIPCMIRETDWLGHKDPNEALCADPEGFKALCRELQAEGETAMQVRAAQYQKTAAASFVDAFVNSLLVPRPAIKTGFDYLDQVLGGGLYEGLYVLGAIPSLGKTTLAMQIADNIAKGGRDVLLFSLEMSRRELIAKSISRLTLEKGFTENPRSPAEHASTTRWVMNGNYSDQEFGYISAAIESYRAYAGRLFIVEGVGNVTGAAICEQVEKHIRITGRKPVVFIDYMQILAPTDVRATDKQNTDLAVLALKRISRDHGIPVVCISSYNRMNYSEGANMSAFKESGAIEYGADVLIGLQLEGVGEPAFNVDEAKQRNPRRVEAVVLKNRSGVTGCKVCFEFYPAYNYFSEDAAKNAKIEEDRKKKERF